MKKHTLTLDENFDDESPLLDNIAILLFRTDTPNYLFADDLNHLYRISLARIDDIALPGASLPLYIFHDSLSYLDYYLVDLTLAQSGNPTIAQSKLLIIRGEATDGIVQKILRDFNEQPTEGDPNNPLLQHRNDTLLSYQQALTSVTRYDPQFPATLSKKAAKERQELDNLLTSLIDYIDINHL